MLEVKQLVTGYGEVSVLHGVDFTVRQGELVSILGTNGAGKTTTLRTISGLLHTWSGTVVFEGREIQKWSPDKIVELGLIQVPEGRKLFSDMSVLDNLELGAYVRNARAHAKKNLENVFELFPILKERQHQTVGSMSGGQQQMVAVGRALMSSPKLLLLDEPSTGLSPLLTKQLFQTIQAIRSSGVTVLLIEQNALQALALSDRGYVLKNGHMVMEGTGEELLNNEELKEHYLGVKM